MSILSNIAEDCNSNPTANEINAASSKSTSTGSVLESGGEEKKPVREWDTLSKQVAIEMNPRQPDLIAALLFSHICFRIKDQPLYCLKDGKFWYFRGAEELRNDEFPYLSIDEIYNAFSRLEKKRKIEIAPPGKYGSTHWYHISEKGRKAHASNTKLWLRQDEAIRHGMRKALLLANLHWEFDHWKKFETDAEGNKYGILSPGTLSKKDKMHPVPPLPMSRDTIATLLKELCMDDRALVRHPNRKHYYTFASTFIGKTACDASKSPHRDVEDYDPNAEDHESPVEDHDSNVEVNDPESCKTNGKSLHCADLCHNTSRVYSNTNSKEDSKLNSKGNSFSLPASASPVQGNYPNLNMSSNAKKLMQLIHEGMKEARQNQKSVIAPKSKKVTPDQLPYDDISKCDYELPYDIIIPRAVEIGNAVKWIKNYWRTFKVRYTKEDVTNLTRLFIANPALTLKDWQEIEYAIGSSQLERYWLEEAEWSDSGLTHMRTAKDRLHYLPGIIVQIHVNRGYDPELNDIVISGKIPEPYASLDFSVLEDVAEGDLWRIVPPPLQFVTQEVNPIV